MPTHTTDILIVGGSLAGLAAAITAKETNPELTVTVVEKYTAGYAGKANRGAGIITMLGNSKPEDFVAYHTKYVGDYLNDQEGLLRYARGMNDSIDAVDRWSGGKVCKNPDGSYRTLKWLAQITGEDEHGKRTFSEPDHFPWTLVSVDLDYMVQVRNYAVRAGVQVVDRVGVVDVLTDGGRISGAVGYHIDSGEQWIFQAKTVVLATGSQNYRIMPMWSPGRGEGLAAAWRAGAKFTNCEFGSFYNWTSLDNFESSMGVEFALFNDKGENVCLAHTAGEHPDMDQNSLAEWYKQVKAGNGPMHYRQNENPLMPYLTSILASDSYYDRPFADRFWGGLFFNAFTQQTSDEVVPGLIGEFSGLWVDQDWSTSVPGLLAAGDICYGGSRVTGAVPPPPGRIRGSGLAFALYSGRMAGVSAANYAAGHTLGQLSQEQIQAADRRFRAPLTATGAVDGYALLDEIHKVMQPLGNSLYRRQDRIEGALARVQELKAQLPQVRAVDPHSLFACNEYRSMLLCAELFFNGSLARKETRGWFLREDYPQHGARPEWYVQVADGDGIRVTTEAVPLDRYPNQPG